jgi:hypothetical protein
VYFPTLMLMPLCEDLDRRARCVTMGSLRTARMQGRPVWYRRTPVRSAQRARSAVSAWVAGAGQAGAGS